ncbi:MAG: hypothetical protein HKP45_09335 [Winogradskyella sp.]|nr:hypothetical protein [Winogradskyella sp.]
MALFLASSCRNLKNRATVSQSSTLIGKQNKKNYDQNSKSNKELIINPSVNQLQKRNKQVGVLANKNFMLDKQNKKQGIANYETPKTNDAIQPGKNPRQDQIRALAQQSNILTKIATTNQLIGQLQKRNLLVRELEKDDKQIAYEKNNREIYKELYPKLQDLQTKKYELIQCISQQNKAIDELYSKETSKYALRKSVSKYGPNVETDYVNKELEMLLEKFQNESITPSQQEKIRQISIINQLQHHKVKILTQYDAYHNASKFFLQQESKINQLAYSNFGSKNLQKSAKILLAKNEAIRKLKEAYTMQNAERLGLIRVRNKKINKLTKRCDRENLRFVGLYDGEKLIDYLQEKSNTLLKNLQKEIATQSAQLVTQN